MIGRPKLVLASGSPRRVTLINQAGIEPDALRPANVDETPKRGELPRACANRLARAKADAVAAQPQGEPFGLTDAPVSPPEVPGGTSPLFACASSDGRPTQVLPRPPVAGLVRARPPSADGGWSPHP